MKKNLTRSVVALMALLLCTCFVTAACADVAINETNFPDQYFREYILHNEGDRPDGILTDAEMEKEREIYLSGGAIKSLKGIEYFKGLKDL